MTLMARRQEMYLEICGVMEEIVNRGFGDDTSDMAPPLCKSPSIVTVTHIQTASVGRTLMQSRY